MGFSREWDDAFSKNTHLSVWPWSDLVSLVMRYARPAPHGESRVIELGCGAGANIPLFLAFGGSVHFFAIDGSANIIDKLKQRYPQLRDRLAVADFTKTLHFDGLFDLIYDRCALTCNTTSDIQLSLDLIAKSLKPEGRYIGVDWYSTEHSEFERGHPDTDPFTRRDFREGTLAGTGRVHFSDRAHLEYLLNGAGLEIEVLQHRKLDTLRPAVAGAKLASWHFVATKA